MDSWCLGQCCLNPLSSKHSCISEQFRNIQEVISLIHHCNNVLLPDDFAEYIYHIGNAHEMHSIMKSGLISGGRSLRKEQAVSVLHSRERDVRL